jgi:hypothetical protein
LTGRDSNYFGAFSADEAGIELYQRLNSWYPAHCCPTWVSGSQSAKAEHLPHAGCIRQQLGLSRCITDAEPTAGVGQTAEQIFFKQ